MLDTTSLAAAVGASVENVRFSPGASNLPRKILIIGTHLASMTLAANVPVRVLSSEDAGGKAGFGSMLERLAFWAFKGGKGVETWILPQAESGGAAAAAGHIDFTDSASVKAGTLHLFVSYMYMPVGLISGVTAGQIATAVVAAVNAIPQSPVTAAVDGVTPGKVNFTSKSKGLWGNGITLALNADYGQAFPSGVVAAVTQCSGGSGVPTVADALAGLGEGDDANENWFTDVVHGYGQDTTTLDAIETYVGGGNTAAGLYSKTVSRPFRALTGDTVAGDDGLSDLTDLSVTRLLDRANGVIAVPGSLSHPSEIAAQAIGIMAMVNQNRVAQHYLGIPLVGVHPGAKADRWTNQYDNRDLAVKSGIGTTKVNAGVVYIQNLVTFYRPANVPVASNGYRSMRNISIIQNMLFNIRLNFSQEKWQGISIVKDCSAVTSTIDRQKARDIDAVIDDLLAIAVAFEGKAWIYDAGFTIDQLKKPGAVTIRAGGVGFDNVLSVMFSGEGGILDTVTQFDTDLTVLTVG